MGFSSRVYQDKDLLGVLENATDEEKQLLVDVLETKLSASAGIKSKCPKELTEEVQRMGGHSFVNFFRGSGVEYAEVVSDVAEKVDVEFDKDKSISDNEWTIVEKLVKDAEKKMSPEEREQFRKDLNVIRNKEAVNAGVNRAVKTSVSTAAIMTSAGLVMRKYILGVVTRSIVQNMGIKYAAGGILKRSTASYLGPLGVGISAVWIASDIAGPAYSVTIPAVMIISSIRTRLKMEAMISEFGGPL